jgi:hypothetical protein
MRQIQEASWGNTKLIPQRFPNRWVIMKLTTASVALPEGKVDAIFFDEELTGFGLRLRRGSGGRIIRNWIIQYRASRAPDDRWQRREGDRSSGAGEGP